MPIKERPKEQSLGLFPVAPQGVRGIGKFGEPGFDGIQIIVGFDLGAPTGSAVSALPTIEVGREPKALDRRNLTRKWSGDECVRRHEVHPLPAKRVLNPSS